MRLIATLLALFVLAPVTTAETRILFIGNSLTRANDLPGIVCRMARASGHEATCQAVVRDGFSLDDHLIHGEAQRLLAKEKWTFVVLQQGPSALGESRVAMRRATQRFSRFIRKAGARPALYAVWPWKSRSFDFDRVSETYRLSAEDVDGIFLPAGDAWRAAWKRDPSLALYGPDDFHPSPAGTYLAALVIYRGLFGEIPESFSDSSGSTPFPEDVRLSEDKWKLMISAVGDVYEGRGSREEVRGKR